jgi:hypothetical protein
VTSKKAKKIDELETEILFTRNRIQNQIRSGDLPAERKARLQSKVRDALKRLQDEKEKEKGR